MEDQKLNVFIFFHFVGKTRSRDLVDTFYGLGLSISYDRVLAISTDLGNSVCQRYEREQLVCPIALRKGLFTTAAVNNIDHNPSATTSKDSFHGTGISLFQHPSARLPGEEREPVALDLIPSNGKTVSQLPETYTNVQPVVLPKKDPSVPENHADAKGDLNALISATKEEFQWLETVRNVAEEQESFLGDKSVLWGVYHSSKQQQNENASLAISSLMPLFPDQAKSVAMIRHSMDVIEKAVGQLNPGQIPVIAMDQPLFTIGKQIQWNWPKRYGEDKFILMFGGLYIEMAFLKLIGNWLKDSGWVASLVEGKVASSGRAESFLKATSVT